MQIIQLLQARFEKALDGLTDDPAKFAKQVAVARDPKHGDYQANIAMPLAKSQSKNPREVAEEIVGKVDVSDLCHEPEIAGPGFINLRLKDDFLAQQLTHLASDERLTVQESEPRTFVIDYSSPNVAKPMHVGHIRTTVIGDSLARVLRFLGHKVVTDNHLGDWGTQFGMIIYGYKHFCDQAAFEQKPVAELSRIYRVVQTIIGYQGAQPKIPELQSKLEKAQQALSDAQVAAKDPPVDQKKAVKKALKAAERAVKSASETLEGLRKKVAAVEDSPELSATETQHPNIEREAQLETAKLHAGDAENIELWQQFMPISITEIESVYERLDVKFDHTFGESFYHPMLADVVQGLVDKGLAKSDGGAMCVFPEGFETPMIIQKSDGAFLYATTDLATVEYRMKEFAPDAILYVVDHRQGEHFDKLFAVARLMGYEGVELNHVSFGTVLGKDGKPFKTREGTALGLESLLDEAVDRARNVVEASVEKGGQDIDHDEIANIAQVVGLGAIKYADLSHNRTSDYVFDLDAMVQLTGDTSAYIQYMYARSQSILGKSSEDVSDASIGTYQVQLAEPAERKLVMQLLQFEDALLHTVEEYYPSVLAGYLQGLAKQFATFFDQCSVLKAETEALKRSRLAICYATGRVLKQGLDLLGIQVVPRM